MPEIRNLVWVDLETTGLDPQCDRILEIGIAVTDLRLFELETFSAVLQCEEKFLCRTFMDDCVISMHLHSGLLREVQESTLQLHQAEPQIIELIGKWAPGRTSPMCGSSVHFDRAALRTWMPAVERLFHWRNLDVSCLTTLRRMWMPYYEAQTPEFFEGEPCHRALSDIRYSISRLAHYKNHMFRDFSEPVDEDGQEQLFQDCVPW